MFSEVESGIPIGSKIQIKIHETVQNGQCNDIASEPSYSVLSIQNKNTSRSLQASISVNNNISIINH